MNNQKTNQITLVKHSCKGKRWTFEQVDERASEYISQKYSIDLVLAEFLTKRNINPEEIDKFLTPSLRDSLPDPSILKEMDLATDRLSKAITNKEKIGIFGDYDVDGTTSTALLARYFDALGVDFEAYLPDRFLDGYGPNLQAFHYLQGKGASLIVTVDCGANAHEVLEEVHGSGLDVVVLDHHLMTLPAPPASAIVNPNRPDDISGLENLSAVGVTFMMLISLNRALREQGYFKERNISEPNLLKWLDLVALGLVCDVMELTGLTRVLVAQGLKVIGNFSEEATTKDFSGLIQLAQNAKASGHASAYHLGFVLGPRINAAGRIGHAKTAYQLMKASDHNIALQLVHQLHTLNDERKEIEAAVLDACIQIVEQENQAETNGFILVSGEGWHEGVIGIVAGRLKEKYHVPAIVVSLENGVGKGSGRSVAGFNLGEAITKAVEANVLTKGGGHAMAAGLSVSESQLSKFNDYLKNQLKNSVSEIETQPTLIIDSKVGVGSVSRDLTDQFEKAAPFGNGNPEPIFMLENVHIKYADIKGGQHVACTFSDDMGNSARGIAFRCVGESLGDALLSREPKKWNIVGKIQPDEWRGGRAAQIIIEDAAPA